MDTWAEEAVRELQVELKRLDLDAETKRAALERAQADYDTVMAEQATVREMLTWASKRLPVQDVVEVTPTLRVQAYASRQLSVAGPPAQTDLAIQALRQLGGSATTVQVREQLEQAGYQYNQTQIRSALKYLARKNNPEVEATGPGAWRLRSGTEDVPLTSAHTPAMYGIGGSP